MSVIIVGNEKNFAALRPRLFGGRVSNRAVGEISAAIQKANPNVDFAKLVPGTVLEIPDELPHVAVEGGLSLDERSRQALAATLETGAAGIAQLVAGAQRQASDVAAERKRLASTLETSAIKTAARRDATVAASVKAARIALDAAAGQAKARQAALTAAQTEWAGELNALKALLPLR